MAPEGKFVKVARSSVVWSVIAISAFGPIGVCLCRLGDFSLPTPGAGSAFIPSLLLKKPPMTFLIVLAVAISRECAVVVSLTATVMNGICALLSCVAFAILSSDSDSPTLLALSAIFFGYFCFPFFPPKKGGWEKGLCTEFAPIRIRFRGAVGLLSAACQGNGESRLNSSQRQKILRTIFSGPSFSFNDMSCFFRLFVWFLLQLGRC